MRRLDRQSDCNGNTTPAEAGTKSLWRKNKVNTTFLKLYLRFQELTSREEGQDMVEYALVLGLICFGAASCSKFLSAALATTFENLSSNIGSYVS